MNRNVAWEHTSSVLEYHFAIAPTFLKGSDDVWNAVTAVLGRDDCADSTTRLRLWETPWRARVIRRSLSVRDRNIGGRRKHNLKRCQHWRDCEKVTHIRLEMFARVCQETKEAQRSGLVS